jgi:hypothetical protein
MFGYQLVKETSREELLRLLESQLPLDVGFDLVRVGGKNDGGYLLPDDLLGITKCISPGCDKNASFENDLLTKFGIPSVIIDKDIAKPSDLDRAHEYIEKWVGVEETCEMITLDKVMALHPDGDLILQMDIEGAEYEVLLNLSKEDLTRFRIILVEFHSLSQLKNPIFFEYVAKSLFNKLSNTHVLVHAHPNNCLQSWEHQGLIYPEVIEYSYLRKDRAIGSFTLAQTPHVLDAPNVLENPEPIISLT